MFAAWGEITDDSNPGIAFPFAFTGREYDPETGLYFYRARYYDPSTGRFLSEDPIGFAARDTNLSRYVGNSPPNRVDPSGLDWLDSYASGFNRIFGSGWIETIGGWIYGAFDMIPGGSEFLAHRTATELFVSTVFVTTIVVLSAKAAIAAYGAKAVATGVGAEIVDTAAEMGVEAATGVSVPLPTSPTDLLQDAMKGVAKKRLRKSYAGVRPAMDTPVPTDGPYGHFVDGPTVGPGKNFTRGQKRKILEDNEARNGGVLRDDRTGEELVRPKKHERGVKPPPNEAHVDHVVPKSRGGSNSYANAEVRSRDNKLQKGDKLPDEEQS